MAERIDVGGGNMNNIMQMMMMMEQMDENRTERELARADAQAERDFNRQQAEMGREDQRRMEMFKMYEGLRGETNEAGKRKYSDDKIDSLMRQWYGDKWKGLSGGGIETPESPAAGTNIEGTRVRSFEEAAKERGMIGRLQEMAESGAGFLGGEDTAAGVEAQFTGEGTMPMSGKEGFIPPETIQRFLDVNAPSQLFDPKTPGKSAASLATGGISDILLGLMAGQ